MKAYWAILLLAVPVFARGALADKCANGWISFGNSCYGFYRHSVSVPSKTWEDARIFCKSYSADLVSVGSADENRFIHNTIRSPRGSYWLGLYRNSSGGSASEGWVWTDGNELGYKNWANLEPNNWQNREKCGEMYALSSSWNDISCALSRSFICELTKDGPVTTLAPFPALNSSKWKTDVICDFGWMGFRNSCYKIVTLKRSWLQARRDCGNLGSHLVYIEDQAEQSYFYTKIKDRAHGRFWIGLNDHGNGTWRWGSTSKAPEYTNWHPDGEPNGRGVENCAEMYGWRLAPYWNDLHCSVRTQYICEKEGGKNNCPDDWTSFGDNCYQFNLAESAPKNWSMAQQACKSFGDFSSLVSIDSAEEQSFLTTKIASISKSAAWIGLNDLKYENIFEWSDNSEINYTNWVNDDPKKLNRPWKDCSVLLGMTTNGGWTMETCSESRHYVCKRKKAMFACSAPLGMENGKIQDDQITAKNSLSPSTGPAMSRLRGDGKWCPKAKDDYLQIDLGSFYSITSIAVQGMATSYCIQYGKDGTSYRNYGTQGSTCQALGSAASVKPHFIEGVRKFVARYLRITPRQGTNRCLRVEIYGCLTESSVNHALRRTTWEKIPSTTISYQINHLQLSWTDARSYCLEQNADLMSIGSAKVAEHISRRFSTLRPYSFWFGFTSRDYKNLYYWSDASPVGFLDWSSYSRIGQNHCVHYRRLLSSWQTTSCQNRLPFVCMKKDPDVPVAGRSVVQYGITGVWMSSATYYWPLSGVDDGKISGTITGQAYGKIEVTSGVNDKTNSSLKFSKSGLYIDVPFSQENCLTFPDVCPEKQLTVSFMASFDRTAASWDDVVILDSLGGNEMNSTGLSVTVKQNTLQFVVSYVDHFWKISTSIQGDGVWRHYVMTCSGTSNAIVVYVNGKSVTSWAYKPTHSKKTYSKNVKKTFHIGILPSKKVVSGSLALSMLAFWDSIIPEKDVQAIYRTEFGWCPNGWFAFGMSCYLFNSGYKSWSSARSQCQGFGGDLMTINSPVEDAMIADRAEKASWIGLINKKSYRGYGYRRRYEKELRWANDEPTVFTNFAGQSSSYRYYSCVSVDPVYASWSLASCFRSMGSICKKGRDGTKPTVNTTVVNRPTFTRICQYSTTTLGCPRGSVIKIKEGFWGRRRRDLCRYVSIIDCGLDTVRNTTDTLSKMCDGSTTCKVSASNSPDHFGNPCTGVYKYLEVNYTCVLKDLGKQHCPSGWVRGKYNGIACYGLIQSTKSWYDAEKACKGYGAQLITIGERTEQIFATALMERAWNTDVWIGLTDKKSLGTYYWADGTPVTWTNWALGYPRGAWAGENCVYMNLDRSLKALMYWRTANCSTEKLFMCKKIISSKSPTSSLKREGTCSLGWTKFKDHCYKYIRLRRTWWAARSHCEPYSYRYSPRASLTSITSKEENDFIMRLTNATVWIGLDGRGLFRGHVWTDNVPVTYTNWDVGQPDSYNGREACTQQYADLGSWADINCYSLRPFVCKKGVVYSRFPVTSPSVTPTFAPSPRCKSGWSLFENMCYFVGSDKNSSYYKTWHEADTSCRLMSAHLVSVGNSKEKDFLVKLTRQKRVYSFWIGLHDIGGESLYKWTDGTGYGKFVYWSNGEPNNYHGQEDCIAMLKTSGKWNDNHCSRKTSYICKATTEDAPKVAIIKPAIKVVKDGYCHSGWIPNGQFCYQFNTYESDYKSWRDAQATCEKGKNSSAVGELVSITNEIEQAFITLHLKGKKAPMWIGMNNLHDYRSFYWTDSSPANYFHWNRGHPPPSWSRCVEISPFERDAGRWNSVSCHKKNGYICKTAASSAPLTPTPTPRRVLPPPTEPTSFTCSREYIRFDKSCYKFVNINKNFDEARRACREEEAELISIDSEFEQALLVFLLERNLGNVWIGLSHEPWSALKFSDHSVPRYSYWGAGEPDRALGQRTCVQANVTGSHVGRWADVDCKTKNPYVCEVYYGEPKITLEENTTCEREWQKYGKNCYRYFPESRSWPAARYTCRSAGGDLLSIADDAEQDFVMYYFANKRQYWVWIGLHDLLEEGGYEWSDGSAVTYVNWDVAQPNDARQQQNCVLMDIRSGRWLDMGCYSSRSFFCKKSLVCSSKFPLDTGMITISNDIAANLSSEQAILKDDDQLDSAWCPNITTVPQPRIQVDLFKLVKITSITIKGRQTGRWGPQHFVKSFFVEFTADGWTWIRYSQDGVDKEFFGNHNGYNAVTRKFAPPIVASSIAVLPKVVQGQQPCMKFSLQGCEFVCQSQLGMGNWKIPDNAITAKSAKYPDKPPKDARVKLGGWCAQDNDKNQWIQVNFGRTTLVTKIKTWGDTNSSYVKTYKISFSDDGLSWVDYVQHSGVRIFKGNLHAVYPVTHSLSNAFQASYIRIIPISWKNNICMRFELFGCVADCDQALIQRHEATLSSSDSTSKAEDARMDSGRAWCTKPKTGQYLEIDFKKRVRLRHIVIKGSPKNFGDPRSVSTYTLQIYINKKWKPYKVDNSRKYIVADGPNGVSKYSFPGRRNYPLVQKIRIYPEKFTKIGICMRVEFYGCLAEQEIIPTTMSITQKVIHATIRITSLEWKDNFKDQNSVEFKKASNMIVRSVTDIYENNEDYREGEALREVTVRELRKGSVFANLKLVFNPRFAENENVSKPLIEAVRSGKVGELKVDKNYIRIYDDTTVVKHSARSEDSKLSSGAVAAIVLAVLLVVIIAIGAGIYWRRKRKSALYGPKQFNNPILYSTANTDEFDVE